MSSNAELVALQRALYESRNATRRWLHCTRRDWIVERLARLAAEGPRDALEIGPGSGVYVLHLARMFDRVTISDVHDAFLAAARALTANHRNVTVVRDDIRRPALPAASFDVVLCTEVIEHVRESREALAGMRRLLRPGGVLLLSTPQRFSLLEVCATIAFLPGVIQFVRRAQAGVPGVSSPRPVSLATQDRGTLRNVSACPSSATASSTPA